ncbi:TPA: hypothetical protein DCX15_04825 [bacterium]|nr:hypothetical protein [bacterium]
MRSLKVLIASNGYGEDTIACQLVKELKTKMPILTFKALPIVGEGKVYLSNRIEVLGPQRMMPSGGFVRMGPKYLLKDIQAGLLSLSIAQIRALKEEGKRSDLVITVGDTFLNTFCGFWTKKKTIFVSTAQSINIGRFSLIDIWLMRRHSKVVFPRDEETAHYLRRFGIYAVYLGNIMMDCLQVTGSDMGISSSTKVIGLLPGSKREAYRNLQYILEMVEEIGAQSKDDLPIFLLAVAPSLKMSEIKEVANKKGWNFKNYKEMERLGGFQKGKIEIILSDKFGDVLNRADVVIGLSGTGNEQAVGLGKPVVTFPGDGPQMTLPFLLDQSRLLKGAVIVCPRNKEHVTKEVLSLLADPSRREEIKRIGLERMGFAGGASRIVSYIISEIIPQIQ